jgi:hypothetical protein
MTPPAESGVLRRTGAAIRLDAVAARGIALAYTFWCIYFVSIADLICH